MKKSEMNIELAVLYITGCASNEERNYFDLWLSQSAEHKEQFETFSKYWDITGSSYDNYDPDLNEGWEKVSRETVHKKVETFRQKFFHSKLLRIAAIIALLLTGGYGVRFVIIGIGMPESQLFAYNSDNQLKKFNLIDGSSIWLNANSQIQISSDFNHKNRSVILTGEAYFEISPNDKLPFTINAGGTITEVVGTSFNIKAQQAEDNVRISVYSGVVKFYPAGEEKAISRLLAGDRGIFKIDNHEIIKEEKVDPSNDLAWKTGILTFKDSPISEVCETLTNYYKVKIITDPTLSSDKTFTGNFRKASLEEVLEIIALTLDIEFVKKGNRIVAKP